MSWWCCRPPEGATRLLRHLCGLLEVAEIEAGLDGVSANHEAVAFRNSLSRNCADGAQIEGHTEACQEALGENACRIIAVRRQEDPVAGREQAEQRSLRSPPHAGWKGKGRCVFQMAEQFLRRPPGRIVEAAILRKARRIAGQG